MQAQPFLTFQPSRGQRAGEAMRFYRGLFPDGEILSETLWDANGPGGADAEGTVMTAEFRVAGQRIRCSDSPVGHAWDFTPAMSLWVEVEDADELQRLFDALSEDGTVFMPVGDYGFGQFGWVGDRFGITWQLCVGE
ncbi:VOC family protein [Kytococcus sp. Marseille-QA3725]